MMYLTSSNWKSSQTLIILSLMVVVMGVSFNKTMILNWTITSLLSSNISLSLLLDHMSLLFSATVMLISANVMMFSQFYMMSETHKLRFNQMVMAFVTSMNLFIYSGNLLFMLVGWDGLGMSSFLLVIYYQNGKSLGGGLITLFTNRLGDVVILCSIALMIKSMSWNLTHTQYWQKMVIFLLLMGAMTKSAQAPFSSWLPDAMAAPTPVSALVHSSTLVTAGIFLMIRFNNMMIQFSLSKPIIFIGSLTALSGGVWASLTKDSKKMVAYSTLSHLGFMMAAIGMGYFYLAFLHLTTHAMFKALLFICVGVDISIKSHKQNTHKTNFIFKSQLTTKGMMISLTSLTGLPYLAGFMSKDMIMESTVMENNTENMTILMIAVATSSIYSLRLWSVVTKDTSSSTQFNSHIINKFFPLSLSIFLLSMFSVVMGHFIVSMMWPLMLYTSSFEHWGPMILVMMGGVIYMQMNFIKVSRSILPTLMLQKPLTKIFTYPTMTASFNMTSTMENGLNSWMTFISMTSMAKWLSTSILISQKLRPNYSMMLMLMMFCMAVWLCY